MSPAIFRFGGTGLFYEFVSKVIACMYLAPIPQLSLVAIHCAGSTFRHDLHFG